MQTNNYSIVSTALMIFSSVPNLGPLSPTMGYAAAEHINQGFLTIP